MSSSLFSDTIAAYLAGSKVQAEPLVFFDFATQPMRLWRGRKPLKTNDGNSYQGLGNLGSIDGIEAAVNGSAPEMSFKLSGVDTAIMHLARDEFASEVRGRLVYVLIQFFGVDDPDDPDNQRCLDNPYPIACGRCLRPEFLLDRKGGQNSVTIKAESLFSLRSRPRYAMYTDADQQHRFAGDEGFEFVSVLLNKVLTWPDY